MKDIGRSVPRQTHRELMWEGGFVAAQIVADVTGRNLSTIHRWAASGKLAGVRTDRRLFIRFDSLKSAFESNPVVTERIKRLEQQNGRWTVAD